MGLFKYRSSNQSNFLEVINVNFDKQDIDLTSSNIIGDFNTDMYQNNKYLVSENNTIFSTFLSSDVSIKLPKPPDKYNLKSVIRYYFHCAKSVQIRSYFWSVFSCIRTKYGKIWSISPQPVRMWENTDQKLRRIWTLFTQCFIQRLFLFIQKF